LVLLYAPRFREVKEWLEKITEKTRENFQAAPRHSQTCKGFGNRQSRARRREDLAEEMAGRDRFPVNLRVPVAGRRRP
jgi:hypothetical protein